MSWVLYYVCFSLYRGCVRQQNKFLHETEQKLKKKKTKIVYFKLQKNCYIIWEAFKNLLLKREDNYKNVAFHFISHDKFVDHRYVVVEAMLMTNLNKKKKKKKKKAFTCLYIVTQQHHAPLYN